MSYDLLPAAGEVIAENLDSPASIQCVGSTSLGSGGLQSLVLAQISCLVLPPQWWQVLP